MRACHGENVAVLRFRVANIVVFVTAALVLVRAHGLAAFGWADTIAVATANPTVKMCAIQTSDCGTDVGSGAFSTIKYHSEQATTM